MPIVIKSAGDDIVLLNIHKITVLSVMSEKQQPKQSLRVLKRLYYRSKNKGKRCGALSSKLK